MHWRLCCLTWILVLNISCLTLTVCTLKVSEFQDSASVDDEDGTITLVERRLKRAAAGCKEGDCKNGGFCNPLVVGSTVCICPMPYVGADCTAIPNYCITDQPEKGIDVSLAPVCLNGGTCTGTILTDPYFSCSCVPGFTGSRCETNIDECAVKPCVHGQCTDLVNSYSCSCYRGWEGSNCQVNHDDCVPGSCLNGGRCVDGNGTATCDCSGTGFSGSKCETNVDDCIGSPCVHGQCTDLVKNYSCSCYRGWEGSNCQVNRDDCVSARCLHGGRCQDGNDTFTCDCSATDYSGAACDHWIDDCALNPCQHGGNCSDGVRSYSCNCTHTGFVGSRCDVSIEDCPAGHSGDSCAVSGSAFGISPVAAIAVTAASSVAFGVITTVSAFLLILHLYRQGRLSLGIFERPSPQQNAYLVADDFSVTNLESSRDVSGGSDIDAAPHPYDSPKAEHHHDTPASDHTYVEADNVQAVPSGSITDGDLNESEYEQLAENYA